MIKTPKLTLPVLFAMLLTGCNGFLAQRMIAPPNGRQALKEHVPEITATQPSTDHLRIAAGPPDAVLAVWVLEPKQKPRGTILVLHGFILDHHSVLGAGQTLCDAGYRAVLVDLRGHGQSTGKYITYGNDDAHDLAQLTTYLQTHDLCGETVGVYGTSYGAASAILFAGLDSRVTTVVAVAPFASLREEAPYFGKHLVPVPGLFMSDADFVDVVNKMGKEAGFDPDNSPLAAIKKTKAQIRLFHGDIDMIVPTKSSEELAAADPERTELTVLHGKGHLELCLDPLGELRAQTRAWFDRYLAGVPEAAKTTR